MGTLQLGHLLQVQAQKPQTAAAAAAGLSTAQEEVRPVCVPSKEEWSDMPMTISFLSFFDPWTFSTPKLIQEVSRDKEIGWQVGLKYVTCAREEECDIGSLLHHIGSRV